MNTKTVTEQLIPPSPVVPTISLDAPGKRHGYLRLPYSRDDSAWGSIMIPLTVIVNGSGPTALLTGANHGDEYEGPIAIQDLAYTLEPEQVQGRIIMIPAFNYPAFCAARRTSPIDHGNLNRSFPGRPDGTVTQKIADYFQRVLIPEADVVLDFHSGGSTLDFVHFAAVHVLDDKQQQADCVAAMQAFNAPYSMMMLEIDSVGMYDTAVEQQGKIFVTTELGGGGSSTAKSAAIARKGVRNLLIHAGILNGEMDIAPTVQLDMPDQDCFVFSEHAGMFDILVDLGESVEFGEPVAQVWSVDRSGAPPLIYTATRSGIVTARHFPGMIKSGDCMVVIADVVDGFTED